MMWSHKIIGTDIRCYYQAETQRKNIYIYLKMRGENKLCQTGFCDLYNVHIF